MPASHPLRRRSEACSVAGLSPSKSETRKAIAARSVRTDGEVIEDLDPVVPAQAPACPAFSRR
ncbi:hypothetical protein BMJ21_18515 [Sinorhizobium medicae]|nr:hypothetical protein BMJ31_13195 [Sinorhizobium medicae]PLU39231.1 hypothetical protein BMJ26_11475 [Sinorhizobium medicae]PLU39416.1 hypothetical protein BMJ28_11145 [Sinorhizobium medicae]PLU49068.1 hypothetical protein BMJ25_12440 [Sinorhizobium medicae]PLU49731.1 hypothetical protein BMJ23_30255 [Sinorhizobium medicae]